MTFWIYLSIFRSGLLRVTHDTKPLHVSSHGNLVFGLLCYAGCSTYSVIAAAAAPAAIGTAFGSCEPVFVLRSAREVRNPRAESGAPCPFRVRVISGMLRPLGARQRERRRSGPVRSRHVRHGVLFRVG